MMGSATTGLGARAAGVMATARTGWRSSAWNALMSSSIDTSLSIACCVSILSRSCFLSRIWSICASFFSAASVCTSSL